MNEREKVPNAFKGNIFPMKIMDDGARENFINLIKKPIRKQNQVKGIKILTPNKYFKDYQ